MSPCFFHSSHQHGKSSGLFVYVMVWGLTLLIGQGQRSYSPLYPGTWSWACSEGAPSKHWWKNRGKSANVANSSVWVHRPLSWTSLAVSQQPQQLPSPSFILRQPQGPVLVTFSRKMYSSLGIFIPTCGLSRPFPADSAPPHLTLSTAE